MVKKFAISLPLNMFAELEKARGLIPRSRFIAEALKVFLRGGK